MFKKVFLISLLMLVISVLFNSCDFKSPTGPSKPDNPTKTYTEIDAHYYRVKIDFPDDLGGQFDKASILCSWLGRTSRVMEKVEENHFKIYLEKVPVNAQDYPNMDKAHYVSVGDALRKDSEVGEKLIFNGTELVNRYYTSRGEMRYFWIDGNGKIIQSDADIIQGYKRSYSRR